MRLLKITFGIIILLSCNSTKKSSNYSATKKLVFKNCLLDNKGFNILWVDVPKGYILHDYNYHGFCEYRFNYPDSSIFYVSTDVYSGSRVNWDNRLNNEVDTYVIGRSTEPIDTIKNSGIQVNGNYWLEYILGGYVVGYSNIPPSLKNQFDRTISSIRK